MPRAIAKSRQTAFSILARHGEALRDDVSLNDLIDDIAAALDEAAQKNRKPRAGYMQSR